MKGFQQLIYYNNLNVKQKDPHNNSWLYRDWAFMLRISGGYKVDRIAKL